MSVFHQLSSSATAQRLGWTLLHSLWQFAAIAAVLWLLLAGLRRASANVRYVAACFGMLLMLAAALATYRSPLASPPRVAADSAMDTNLAGPAYRTANGFLETHDAARAQASPVLQAPVETANTPLQSQTPSPVREATPPSESRVATLPRLNVVAGNVAPWLPWITLAWLGGVVALSLRHVAGWLGAERLRRRRTTSVAPELRDRAYRLMDRMKVTRPVTIAQSALADVPIVVGWLRPVILLPPSLLTGLSPHQLEAILAHELAHVRRCDYFVNLLQTAIDTLLFYHPAVWWLSRRIRIEREHCCDDVAVAACGSSVEYAEALAAVEARRAVPEPAMAVSGRNPMATLARVRRILGVIRSDRGHSGGALAASLLAASIAVTLAGYVVLAGASVAQETDATTTTDEEEGVGAKVIRLPQRVRGRVLDHTGKPVAGAVVYLAGGSALESELLELWNRPPHDFSQKTASRPTTTTDEQGRFVLAQYSDVKDRVVVTSPKLTFWVVPAPEPGREVTIRLPEPAALRIRYDVRGAGDEVDFHFHLKTWEMDGWDGLSDSRQYTQFTVTNPTEVAWNNLTPGRYDLARRKHLRVGDLGMGLFCDHRDITLVDGETFEVNLVRRFGQTIRGEVIGLEGKEVAGAFIFIKPADAPVNLRQGRAVSDALLEAVTCGVDGQFQTETLPPGEYSVIVHAYGPDNSFSGWRLPDLVGMAKVTVAAQGPPPQVRVEVVPRDEVEIEAEQVEPAADKANVWGEAVEGVRMRVTQDEFTIAHGELIDLKVDIHNGGDVDRAIDLESEAWHVEIDGEWVKMKGAVSGERNNLPLAAGQTQRDVEVTPWLWENMKEALQKLPPGRHTLRVARVLDGLGRSSLSPPQIRVVSQSVEIHVIERIRQDAVEIDDLIRVAGIKLQNGNSDPATLLDLYEEVPPGSRSYEIRKDVVSVPIRQNPIHGSVYYLPDKNVYYIQRDPLTSSRITYYGPFPGDPRQIVATAE